MKSQPLIANIKGNSLDDGPGIRSVVFFKGCPLNCDWCHNPECISPEQELFYDSEKCIGCGTCTATCPEKAISVNNPLFVNRGACRACLECVEVCPAEALTPSGEKWSLQAAVDFILKDKPFFDNTGGGVTLSGGEPSLYPDYAGKLLRIIKGKAVHTIVETCGHFEFAVFRDKMLPYTDMIYVDLKLMDPEDHKQYCGVSNDLILENIIRLQEISRDGNFSILPRIPLVPGITAAESNLVTAAGFLRKNGFSKAVLLPYNPLWGRKLNCLGRIDPYPSDHPLRQWMPEEDLQKCQRVLSACGL